MRKRIHEYDLIRVLATLGVVIIHTSASTIMVFEAYSVQSLFVIYLNRLLAFVVPVFIFLAGAVVHDSYEERAFGYSKFLIGKMKRVLGPYMIASVVYYVFLMYLSKGTFDVKTLTIQLFTGSAQYHLYFIPILMQMYVLTPVFLWLKKKVPQVIVLPLLIGISYVGNLKGHFPYSDRIFFKYMVPYVIGLYFGRKLVDWLKSLELRVLPIFLLTVIAGGIYSYNFMRVFYGLSSSGFWITTSWYVYGILSCLTLVKLTSGLVKYNKLVKLSDKFSALSYTIYLIHPLVITLIIKVLNRLQLYSTSLKFVVTTIFAIVISVVLAAVIKRLNLKSHGKLTPKEIKPIFKSQKIQK